MQTKAEDESLLSLRLNNIKLVFDGRKWKSSDTVIEQVTDEINSLLDEREEILAALDASKRIIDELRKEVVEVNVTKRATMELLIEERQKNIKLEKEVQLYKEELDYITTGVQ